MWKSSVRCLNEGAKAAAAQPVSVTSWHDVPSGGPTNSSPATRRARSRHGRQAVAGGQDGVERVGQQRARAKRGSSGACRDAIEIAMSTSPRASARKHSGASSSSTSSAEPRVARAQRRDRRRHELAERGREARDAHRADDALCVGGDVGGGGLELREHDVGVADERLGGAGQPHAAAVALDRRLPTSRSSAASCCDTADGVRCSASAAAASVPCWATSRSTRRRRASIMQQSLRIRRRNVFWL